MGVAASWGSKTKSLLGQGNVMGSAELPDDARDSATELPEAAKAAAMVDSVATIRARRYIVVEVERMTTPQSVVTGAYRTSP